MDTQYNDNVRQNKFSYGIIIFIFFRVVPDTDFEPGYRIPGYPGFENPDSDIRPDIRRLPDTGWPAGYSVFPIGFFIFFNMHS